MHHPNCNARPSRDSAMMTLVGTVKSSILQCRERRANRQALRNSNGVFVAIFLAPIALPYRIAVKGPPKMPDNNGFAMSNGPINQAVIHYQETMSIAFHHRTRLAVTTLLQRALHTGTYRGAVWHGTAKRHDEAKHNKFILNGRLHEAYLCIWTLVSG
jgi:hypothetical protein